MSTIFEEIAKRHIECEICQSSTIALYGCGWDNDRIYCANDDCGAEYEFPTSTVIKEAEQCGE